MRQRRKLGAKSPVTNQQLKPHCGAALGDLASGSLAGTPCQPALAMQVLE